VAISFRTILDPDTTNIAELMDDDALGTLGQTVVREFEEDMQSRQAWTEKTTAAMDLALQVSQEKTWPWEKASNVKLPLITIAALQFSARAYPALISNSNVVKTRMYGEPTPEKIARAARVQQHMSYQLLEEDEEWEEEMDRLLITIPIVGCSFKKTYFDPDMKRNRSVHVLANDFVVDYWTKSLSTSERATHRFHLRDNKVTEHRRSGFYLDIDLGTAQKHNDVAAQHRDSSQGTVPTTSKVPREILEQHRYMDLDDDGYDEPYIVTVDRTSSSVLRIGRRFEPEEVEMNSKGEVSKISPNEHFTKYGFIPSPDGGFYDLGFGHLMGPLSHAIDTNINQLVDAGTLSNLQSGFLGRGIKLRRGDSRFKPGEWKSTGSSGENLRNNIVPLPVRDPSQTLFALLNMLVEYAERISSVSDMMSGQNPGQNQPATTSMAVLEQGMKVFTGIFKRIHRCMRDEFRKLYRVNQIYLDSETTYTHKDEVHQIFQADYSDPFEIKPASDPSMVSDTQQAMQAEALVTRAAQVPGYNRAAVEMRYLQALHIEDIEQVYPDPKGPNAIPAGPNIDMLKLQIQEDTAKSKFLVDMAGLIVKAAEAEATITKLEAESINLLAKAEAEEIGPQMNIYKMQLDNMKDQRKQLVSIMEKMSAERERVSGVESPPSN